MNTLCSHNTPQESPEEPSSSEFITLQEAADALHLRPLELAYFLFYHTKHVQVYMHPSHFTKPVPAGFYGPGELLGQYMPQVRLLASQIQRLHDTRIDDIANFVDSGQYPHVALSEERIAAVKSPIRRVILRIVFFVCR